jgi:hypothetical protein
VPSRTLAGLADAITGDGGLAELDDDELIEAIRAWQRVRSWARANRLAVVAELARRSASGTPAAPGKPDNSSAAALQSVNFDV